MKKINREKRGYWTFTKCLIFFKKCKNRGEVKNKYNKAYSAAQRHGWLKKLQNSFPKRSKIKLDDKWCKKFNLLKKYIKQHKHVPNRNNKILNNVNLYNWYGTQLKLYNEDKLNKERKKLLEKIIDFNKRHTLFFKNFNLLNEFLKKFKKFPTKYDKYKKVDLGQWYIRVMNRHKKNKLTKNEKKLTI